MNLPRQPQVVRLYFEGNDEDIAFYADLIKRSIESLDDVVEYSLGGLIIYPHAVND